MDCTQGHQSLRGQVHVRLDEDLNRVVTVGTWSLYDVEYKFRSYTDLWSGEENEGGEQSETFVEGLGFVARDTAAYVEAPRFENHRAAQWATTFRPSSYS